MQAPGLPLSFFPTLACPEMCGALVTAGRSMTTSLRFERAAVVPARSVAETRASSVCPASAGRRAYAVSVAPGMGTQPLPSAPQRSH